MAWVSDSVKVTWVIAILHLTLLFRFYRQVRLSGKPKNDPHECMKIFHAACHEVVRSKVPPIASAARQPIRIPKSSALGRLA